VQTPRSPERTFRGGPNMNNINRDIFVFNKDLDDYQQFLNWKAKSNSNRREITLTRADQVNLSANYETNASELLLLTPEEAGKRLSIGRSSVYELMGNGSLESVTIGRSRRIPSDALKVFVERLRGENSDQLTNLKATIMHVPDFDCAKVRDKDTLLHPNSTLLVGA
jgi:excisionase family DNA binding protein